ncbi:MAG TPA: UPF0182 family protein, partial [Longimicrobiaceae bacterium]|nr:UPF0182 family protein [Longimicrobiaceae bacterium]
YRWGAGLGVRVIAGLLIGAFVFANLWRVSRSLGTIRVRRRYGNIEIAERLPQVYIVGALVALSALSAWWLSAGLGDPITFLAALNPERWGVSDPIFGRDISFYIFRLPVLGRLQLLFGLTIFWTGLLVAAAYVTTDSIRITENRPQITPAARKHLGLLLAAFLLVVAWDFWLDRYGLVISGNGIGGALGYTDFHARLPGKLVSFALAVAAAGAIAFGAWRGSLRAPAVGLGALLIGTLIAQGVYPASIQKLGVDPDEFAKERRYIQQHLAFTRRAVGLRDLQVTELPYRDGGGLNDETITRALAGVPLWGEDPLLQGYQQKQSFVSYYDFLDVEFDRYGPPGEAEQVGIAVRELDFFGLPASGQTWQNRHLNYISGEGAVVSPVTGTTEVGAPRYYLSDLNPPQLAADAPAELALTSPEIYFGEQYSQEYVIVQSEDGPEGIPLDAFWKKLIFAWAFQSKNLLLSGELGMDSRFVFRRGALERAAEIAPFLHFNDGSAYPVIRDGRVIWIIEGFTTSTYYPLAPVFSLDGLPVRYVRNSVKATVDAVSGDVSLYATSTADPLLRTYANLFPGLVEPMSAMPADLQQHLRYPASLLALQARALSEYHLRDPAAFYAKQDVWNLPLQTLTNEVVPVKPRFAMLPLPGSEELEFLLSVPFVAAGRQNMTAILVARNDAPNYGEQILYELPRDELIPGPQQIEAMIDQDPEISEQLSLWKRGGSDVIRGNLTVVPVGGTLLYVEPIYLVADEAAIPQLERVVVANSRRPIMRPTLAAAISALSAAAEPGVESIGDVEDAPATTPGMESPAFGQARALLDRAERQSRAGDWAAFGATWEQLKAALNADTLPDP